MITEFDSDFPVEVAYKEIQKQSCRGEFEPISSVKNEQMVFKGKRDYSGTILGILIVVGLLLLVVGLIIAAIYYWTRPYTKIIIELEPRDGGSAIKVITVGNIDNVIMYEIEKALKSK